MKTRNTNFILDYSNHSRSLFLKSRSPDINFDDINHNAFLDPPDIIVLVPLCNEISNEFVEKIAGRFPNAMIGMDLQGFIRKIDADGKVSYIYDDFILANIKKIIDSVGDRLILKGSEIEMKLLAQKEDSHEVMDFFNSFGTKGIFIMTLGENGSIILKKGENLLEIPAYKSNGVVDETGAGDVYLAIFLYEIFNTNQTWGDIEQAARYASSAASFLIEKKGPNGFKSRDKIIKRTNKGVYTNKI
jgi:sugar/nucleoside kinase (ribokinase family)